MMGARSDMSDRGSVLLMAVIVLTLLNLVVVSVLAGSGDDAQIGVVRMDSAKALYASASGEVIAVKQQVLAPANPVTGTVTLPGNDVAQILDPFAASPAPAGVLIVEGRVGQTRRSRATTMN